MHLHENDGHDPLRNVCARAREWKLKLKRVVQVPGRTSFFVHVLHDVDVASLGGVWACGSGLVPVEAQEMENPQHLLCYDTVAHYRERARCDFSQAMEPRLPAHSRQDVFLAGRRGYFARHFHAVVYAHGGLDFQVVRGGHREHDIFHFGQFSKPVSHHHSVSTMRLCARGRAFYTWACQMSLRCDLCAQGEYYFVDGGRICH